jgi:hypothetical protein
LRGRSKGSSSNVHRIGQRETRRNVGTRRARGFSSSSLLQLSQTVCWCFQAIPIKSHLTIPLGIKSTNLDWTNTRRFVLKLDADCEFS